MAKFSIIVVCLNPGERLQMTVESILEQTCADYEIIVKDGISTDGSVEKLPGDERIRVFREKDKGIYDAMNQAVEKVRGEYVYFLNCGDSFYDGGVLRRVKERMEEKEGDIKKGRNGKREKRYIFYGDIYERLTKERVTSNPSMDAFGCYRNVPCHQACFYGAELMKEKGFDIRYKVRADYEHFLWCFFRGNAKTIYIPVLIADYEGGGFSERKENRKVSAQEHKEIVRKYMSRRQVLKYRLIMTLTLARFRTWLAGNETTAHVYNWVKRKLYRK